MAETKERVLTGTVEIKLEVPAQFYRIMEAVGHANEAEVRETVLYALSLLLEGELERNESIAECFGFEDCPDIAEKLRALAGLLSPHK